MKNENEETALFINLTSFQPYKETFLYNKKDVSSRPDGGQTSEILRNGKTYIIVK